MSKTVAFFILIFAVLLGSCGNNSSDKVAEKADSTAVVANPDSSKVLPGLRFCTQKLPYPKREFKFLYKKDTILISGHQKKFDTAIVPPRDQKAYMSSLNGYVWNKND